MIKEVRFSDDFQRAFKRLKKRYRSLPDDLKQLKPNIPRYLTTTNWTQQMHCLTI